MISIQSDYPGQFLMVADSATEDVNIQWFDAEYWKNKNAITGTSAGRNITYFFKNDTKEYVLRQYYRGGLFAKINKDKYRFRSLETSRVYRELTLLCEIKKLNLPAPAPIAGLLIKSGGFYKAKLIIEKIENAVDCFHTLISSSIERNLWKKIGMTIRRFHDHQIYHSDLNIHNIMTDDQGNVWLIDFDKGEIKDDQDSWKPENLSRLKRSLLKEKKKQPQFHWDEPQWLWLLEGYEQ